MHLFRTLICFFLSIGSVGFLLLSLAGPMAPVTLRAGIQAQTTTTLPAIPLMAQPAMTIADSDVTYCPGEVAPKS